MLMTSCRWYMPPEYIDMGFISKKFDVFSLGVIMIKILAGNNGYYRCSKMSPEQFLELVRKFISVSNEYT